jgi:hypothetical protein
VTLLQMILGAYEIQDFQLLGRPGWVNDDRCGHYGQEPRLRDAARSKQPQCKQRRTIQSQMQNGFAVFWPIVSG